MIHYSSVNLKISNSQFDKLKLATKIETEVILRLSSNIIVNSNDETNFTHKLKLTVRQKTSLCKVLTDNSSVN